MMLREDEVNNQYEVALWRKSFNFIGSSGEDERSNSEIFIKKSLTAWFWRRRKRCGESIYRLRTILISTVTIQAMKVLW